MDRIAAMKRDSGRINVLDTRAIDSVTGKPIAQSDRMHAKADPDFIRAVVLSARQHNIDPYTALAIAHQESEYGHTEGEKYNPFSIDSSKEEGGENFVNIDKKGGIPLFMELFNKKLQLAKSKGKTDEASQIQAWNGYGHITPKSEDNSNKYYGIDVRTNPIDMNTNPVYGKRILDIRENIIKKNPDITRIVALTNPQASTQTPLRAMSTQAEINTPSFFNSNNSLFNK